MTIKDLRKSSFKKFKEQQEQVAKSDALLSTEYQNINIFVRECKANQCFAFLFLAATQSIHEKRRALPTLYRVGIIGTKNGN